MSITTASARPRELGLTAFTRCNPLARLFPALTLAVVNIATISAPVHVATLMVTVLCLPLLALKSRQLWRLTWPLFVATATLFVVNTLANPGPGIHQADLEAGAVTAVRLLAVALPGLVVFATIDAVDLVDALVQQLHVSARFGYGALAGLRLMPMLGEDWRLQSLAGRARGVSPRGPVQRVRFLFHRLVSLLVGAVRRGTRMALALDARGFDQAKRATARPSPWTGADWACCLIGATVAVGVFVVSSLFLS